MQEGSETPSVITKMCDLEKGPNPLWALVPTLEKGSTKKPLRVVDNMPYQATKNFGSPVPGGPLTSS